MKRDEKKAKQSKTKQKKNKKTNQIANQRFTNIWSKNTKTIQIQTGTIKND